MPLVATEMIELAKKDPSAVIDMIQNDVLNPGRASEALEMLGDAPPCGNIVWFLLESLSDSKALIREGAIYGLYTYQHYFSVKYAILDMANNDLSPGVRAAASEFLEYNS